jgi:HEAT repeat protein
MSDELTAKLERAKELLPRAEDPSNEAAVSEVRDLFVDLSLDRYEPAKALLKSALGSSNAMLRAEAVEALGRWNDLREQGTVEIFRQLLSSDMDELVRSRAALELGRHATWPDAVLVQALKADPDRLVRVAAFQSILNLRVPWKVANEETSRLRASGVEPTMELVEQIVSQHGAR